MSNDLKIATMTFHMAHNYGAMLQAYALVKAINDLGYDCEVLDYRFPYIDQWEGVHTRNEITKKEGRLKGNLKYIYRHIKGYYRNISRKRIKFDCFMRNEMRLSKKVYFDRNELVNVRYDAVIFGSDQIWNPDLTNGFAVEYFGKYAGDAKRIAYGASCGTDSFKEEWRETIEPLLKSFTAIGVRESGLAQYIESHYGLAAETVLDPVFLLDKQRWDSIAEKAEIDISEPYLLVYAFQTSNDIYDLARKIAKERKLNLISITYQKMDNQNDIVQLIDCGPLDFVSLIKNAEYVCTTSFHGMAFSIIYEKNFYCIGHPKYSSRNKDLLELIGLQDRLLSSYDESMRLSDCNYKNARLVLSEMIKSSKEFILSNLENMCS